MYGKLRSTPSSETANVFLARDEFDQAAGVLHGKQMPVPAGAPGVWDTNDGAATDASVVAGSSHWLERTAVSDAAGYQSGWFGVAGTTVYAACTAQIDLMVSAFSSADFQGLLMRYVDTSNFLILIAKLDGGFVYIYAIKRVAGANTTLISSFWPGSVFAGTWYTIKTQVTAAGTLSVLFGPQGGPLTQVGATTDSVLATGGALDDGKAGIYDFHPSATAVTRTYDNIATYAPAVDAAIFSGRSARFLHNTALRENAAGTSEGRVPAFEGRHLTTPPATRANRTSRLVVKARRQDVDSGLPDSGLTDQLTASLTVTPRVILTGPATGGS